MSTFEIFFREGEPGQLIKADGINAYDGVLVIYKYHYLDDRLTEETVAVFKDWYSCLKVKDE